MKDKNLQTVVQQKDYLSVADMAQEFGIHEMTFYRMIRDKKLPAFKIGSGDITWLEIIEYIAAQQKPYIIATGASTMDEVDRAVQAALAINTQLALLQCNTNYTASLENFKYEAQRPIYFKVLLVKYSF